MSRFYESDELVITLAMAMLMYALTSSVASMAVGEMMFHGLSREEMVEMAGTVRRSFRWFFSPVLSCARVIFGGQFQVFWWPWIAVEGKRGRPVQIRGVTDEDGDFTIDVPSQLYAIDDLQRKCCVKLLRTPRNSPCRPSNHRERKRVRLSSVGNGVRTDEAGTIKLPLDGQ